MSNNVKVAEATTQKKPQKKARLYTVFKNDVERGNVLATRSTLAVVQYCKEAKLKVDFTRYHAKIAKKIVKKKETTYKKFGYLSDLITDEVMYKEATDALNSCDWNFCSIQNVNDMDGCYIQSILWLCDLADVLEQLEEAGGTEAKNIQAVVNHLNVLMVENDLDFIFI